MDTVHHHLIIIAGPTGSGKTATSLELAAYFDAEIFSADSRQIYKEMNIGTAKPTRDQLDSITHHFIGHVSIHENYSAGRYAEELSLALDRYFEKKQVAILCGGTGLYIRAFLEGIDSFPEVRPEVSEQVRQIYEKKGIEGLQEELRQCDPDYYSMVDLNNPARLIRAIEVSLSAGKSYSSFLGKQPVRTQKFKTIPVLLEPEREELYQQINHRVEDMMAQGLTEEARSLFPYRHLRALDTVGYRELFDYFEGTTDLETAVQLIKQNTRRYAKRQLTWFRKYGHWHRFKPHDQDQILEFVRSQIRKYT